MRNRMAMIAAVAALGVLAAACGGGGTGSADGTPAAGTVSVELKEYSVTPNPASAAAGTVTFNARNAGSMNHELVVIQSELAIDKLPMDASVVDEKGAGVKVIGEIEEFAAGKSESAGFDLAAGSYVLICNVAGHYALGMRSAFTVT